MTAAKAVLLVLVVALMLALVMHTLAPGPTSVATAPDCPPAEREAPRVIRLPGDTVEVVRIIRVPPEPRDAFCEDLSAIPRHAQVSYLRQQGLCLGIDLGEMRPPSEVPRE